MTAQILIADRDPIIREDCRRYLAAHGYEAAVAADALQCIELMKSMSPQVLVLDPDIPWGGGLGVLDWLCEQAPLQPVTVILTNGHSAATFLPEFEHMIACRLERPACLSELSTFINELQRHLSFDSQGRCSTGAPALAIAKSPGSRS